MGLLVVAGDPRPGQALAVPGAGPDRPARGRRHRAPLPRAASTSPARSQRLRLRLDGPRPRPAADLQGAGQTRRRATSFEIRDSRDARRRPPSPPISTRVPGTRALPRERRARDPRRGARRRWADADAPAPAGRAPRLATCTRSLEKKPTVSLPSALEVLKTRVGDCNEHTALYVAMARSLGLPARIAVGLVYLRGAFYYHAWPEVYVPRAPAVGCGCPSIPRSTSSPPTPPTCGSRAAASTSRRRSWASSAAPASTSSTWSSGPGAARARRARPRPTRVRSTSTSPAASRRPRLLVAARRARRAR